MLRHGNHVRSAKNTLIAPYSSQYRTLAPVTPALSDCPCPGTATDYNGRYISMKIGSAAPFAAGTMEFHLTDLCPGSGFLLQFDNGLHNDGCSQSYSVSINFPSPVIGSPDSPYCSVIEFIYDQLVQHPMLSSFIDFEVVTTPKCDETLSPLHNGRINWRSNSQRIKGSFAAWIDDSVGVADFGIVCDAQHNTCDTWYAGEPVGRSLKCEDRDRAFHFTEENICELEFAGFAANNARGGSCDCLRVLAQGTTPLPFDEAIELVGITPASTLLYNPESRLYALTNFADLPPVGWLALTQSVRYMGCCKQKPHLKKIAIHGGM